MRRRGFLQMRLKVSGHIEDQVIAQVLKEVRDRVHEQVWWNAHEQIQRGIYDSFWASIHVRAWNHIRDYVREQTRGKKYE